MIIFVFSRLCYLALQRVRPIKTYSYYRTSHAVVKLEYLRRRGRGEGGYLVDQRSAQEHTDKVHEVVVMHYWEIIRPFVTNGGIKS
jgi:hypothetical protein